MKKTPSELIKEKYPFYDTGKAPHDVELCGEQVEELMRQYADEVVKNNVVLADVVKSLPTDRAIDQAAFESSYGYSDDNYNSFKEGVKWIIEQLKTFNTKEND
jgi:hypothetical protein